MKFLSFLRLLGIAVLTMMVCSIDAPVSVAQTQEQPSAATAATRNLVEKGREQLQAQNYPGAIGTLTQVIRNEKSPPDWMAIAFFYRGIANRVSNKPQAAIADFINALWLNTLPETIQAQVYYHRAHAYAATGKRNEAIADLEEAQKLEPNEQRISQAREQMIEQFGSEVTGSPPPANSPTQPQAPASPEEVVRQALNPAPQDTNVATAIEPEEPALSQLQRQQNAANVQLGALGSQQLAEQEWQRIIARHRDILGQMDPSYEPVSPEGPSLVRLQAGPLASMAAANSLCAQLKARGQDCIAVKR